MKLFIVGAGPGAPDLITVRGMKLVKEADVILYADSLVNEELMTGCKEGAVVLKTAGMHLEEMVETMVNYVKEGKKVVRLHTGDPAIYGAIIEQIALLKEAGIETEIVPGVSSVFAAAAAAGAELTIPDVTQTVILTRAEGRTPVPEKEQLKDLAKHECTIAFFLSATLTKKVTRELVEAGWPEDTPVAVVYRATWPDEKIVRSTIAGLDAAMRENGIRKQAMILAGKALDPDIGKSGHRSKLYDKTFTHGFRKGIKP